MIAALVATASVAIWWALRAGPGGRGPGFNVLLITLDTTRADHVGCYGHAGGHTPVIDRLAAGGTRFSECMAAAPSTLPSHASILTGAYPPVHGVRHNVGYRLGEANLTLPEVLQREGYRTAAFVAAYVVGRDTGLDQGFDTYDDTGIRHERRADEVCDGAIDWLRRHAGEPFFLWTHLFDPHFPYTPPPEFARRYADPYVGEIAFVDQQVGRLLEELRRLRLEDRTLIVVTADHGEGLGEHAEDTHLFYVYDTTMSVPLILHCPGQIPAGCVVECQTRNIDIAPTILTFLGFEPASALPRGQGTSLVSRMTRATDATDLPAYGETIAGRIVLGTSALRCLRTEGWKYIHAPRPELYNLREDPGETRNLAEDQTTRAQAMRTRLRAILATSPEPAAQDEATVRLDRDALDRLQSLGYVGGDMAAEPAVESEFDPLQVTGKDPKDHAADFAASGDATTYMQNGRFAEAETIYRRLVSTFPDSAQLGLNLARAVFLQNRLDEAIAVYRGLLEKHPESVDAHYGLGKLLDRLGKRGEAIEHFSIAAGLDPTRPEVHYDLGVALRKEGRDAEALECFSRAVAARPSYVDARLNLGVGLAAQGRLDEAIVQYREALRYAPGDAVIHFNLGNALRRYGDEMGAIQAYEQALRLRPDFGPARRILEQIRGNQSPGGDEP